jgi:enediyne biosynthesis protein CalE5
MDGRISITMNSEFDPDKFKANQRQSWNSVANGWQKWWITFENGAQQVSDRLIDLAGIRPGHRVLDIATGIGEPATSAAKIVCKDEHVTATEISTDMLAVAEKRARSLGLHDIMDFKQSDAENLELGTNQEFDAILCRWGLMFLSNRDKPLSNIMRLLISRGMLAAEAICMVGLKR